MSTATAARYAPRDPGRLTTRPPEWPDAACRTRPDLDWVPDHENTPATLDAIAVCLTCPHRTDCALYAIRNRQDGIWGGLRTDQRTQLRRAGLAALEVMAR